MFAIELLLVALLTVILFALRKEEHASRKESMPSGKIEKYWDGSERRRHVRLEVLLNVRYSVKKNHELKGAVAKDICERGIRLLVDKKLERGVILDIEIPPDPSDGPIFIEGMVLWSNEARGHGHGADKRMFHVGIKFLKVKKGSEASLNGLISILESNLKTYKISNGVSVNT